MKTLALERRPSKDHEWTPYDPDSIEIRTVCWSASIETSLLEYIESNLQKLIVKKDLLLADLVKILQEKYDLKEPRVLRRTPLMQKQSVEIFSEMESTLN